MKYSSVLFLSLSLIVVCLFASACRTQDVAVRRIAFINAVIYTSDEANPYATAMVVEEKKIIYVGNDKEALNFVKEFGCVRNLGKKLVLPGFFDTHCHPLFYAAFRSVGTFRINAGWDHETVIAKVREFAGKNPQLPVILAVGFGPGCKTLATELDRAVPDRPAVLMDDGCHTGWINTAAMKKMDLTDATPDPMPEIQYFERDKKGWPTGRLVESMPCEVTWQKLHVLDAFKAKGELLSILDFYARHGVTGLFDAGMFFMTEDGHRVLGKLENEGNLHLRYYSCWFTVPTDSVEHTMERLKSLRRFSSPLIHPNVLKLQADGTLEGLTAYMAEPYIPASSGRGVEFYTVEKMLSLAKAATAAGYDTHIHAIGDQAVADALSVFEKLGRTNTNKTIAHVQFLPPDGLARFIALKDVFYQTTPVWLASDDYTEKRVGKARFLRQMPLKSLIKNKVPVTFGSDCPASDGEFGMNPFNNIQYAVVRSKGDFSVTMPPKEEGISVAEAVNCYTINAAKQLGCSAVTGSLTVGKSADFQVLDRNIFQIKPEEIGQTKVIQTYFQGQPLLLQPGVR